MLHRARQRLKQILLHIIKRKKQTRLRLMTGWEILFRRQITKSATRIIQNPDLPRLTLSSREFIQAQCYIDRQFSLISSRYPQLKARAKRK